MTIKNQDIRIETYVHTQVSGKIINTNNLTVHQRVQLATQIKEAMLNSAYRGVAKVVKD